MRRVSARRFCAACLWLLLAGCGPADVPAPDAGSPAVDASPPVDASALDSGPEEDSVPRFAGRVVGDGELLASAGRVVITPTEYEVFVDEDGNAEYDEGERFLDCGVDRLCAGDAGYPGPDRGEGDGEFQALFIGGFQGRYGTEHGGRPVQGVHDDIEARILYLEQGEAHLLLIVLDVVGLFHKYVNLLKRRLREQLGIPPSQVVVAAVHNHEAPDSMGLWSTAGVSAEWIRPVVESILTEAATVVGRAEPVAVRAGGAHVLSCRDETSGELETFEGCTDPSTEAEIGAPGTDLPVVETDLRDPFVRDPLVLALSLESPEGPVATLLDFSLHPETLADDNPLVTSDFVGPARARFEAIAGGTAVYVSGALGGMMTPLHDTPAPLWSEDGARVVDDAGRQVLVEEASFEKARSIGFEIAEAARTALASSAVEGNATLVVRTEDVDVPLDDRYRLLFDMVEFDDEADRMEVRDLAGCLGGCLRTQVTVIRLGPATFVTTPGELLPEIIVGRPAAGGFGAIQALRQLMPGSVRAVIGLANNELGYILPPEDFVGPDDPNYYEESVSPGPEACRIILDAMTAAVLAETEPGR